MTQSLDAVFWSGYGDTAVLIMKIPNEIKILQVVGCHSDCYSWVNFSYLAEWWKAAFVKPLQDMFVMHTNLQIGRITSILGQRCMLRKRVRKKAGG